MASIEPITGHAEQSRDQRWAVAVLAVLMLGTAGLCLVNAGRMPFMDPDEGRCTLIARQMAATGDWIVPRAPLQDAPYFDKPIFYFWLLAGSFSVFGVNELAARLVSAIGAALMVGATYQLGRVLLGPRAALSSALLLATTALTTIAGRFIRMDVWLTALVAWGLYFWARAYMGQVGGRDAHPTHAHPTRWPLVAGYACLAAACLTKGPIGALLPALVVACFLLVRRKRDWKALWRCNLPLGVGIIVLLSGPWFAYMSWRFPGYAADFFFRHHVLRATSGTFGRSGNLLLLPGIVVGGFLPWTVFLVGAVVRGVRQRKDPQWRAGRPGLGLAYWWAIVGVVPFMLFHTKLPVYIMPAFPALALITGDYVAELLDRKPRREAAWMMGATLTVMGLTLVALAITNRLTFDAAPWLTLARRLPVFGGLVLLAIWLLKTARLRGALLAAAGLTAVLTIDATWVEGPGLAEQSSSRVFAEPIRQHQADVDRLVVGPDPHYAVFCYLDHTPPVDYLEHKRDFGTYTGWDQPLLALLTSQSILRTAQARFGDRVTVLAEGHRAWLLELRAGPAAPAGLLRYWPISPTKGLMSPKFTLPSQLMSPLSSAHPG